MKHSKDFLAVILIIVITILIGLIIFSFFDLSKLSRACSEIDVINTSITIQGGERVFVGMNTDTDSLKFGKASPGEAVRRIVKVEYDWAGEVLVEMDSGFSPWTTIEPASFRLLAHEQKEVVFEVKIPPNMPDSELSGTVRFCFRKE